MIKLCVSNQKGGVGKTAIVYHLAQLYAKQGRTLVVDMDSQGNVTNYLTGEQNSEEKRTIEDRHNIAHLFKNRKNRVFPLEIKENLYLIGTNIKLSEFEGKLELDYYYKLQDLLKQFEERFDYVIIDTPPSLGLFTVNAFLAADYILAPIDSSEDAIDGLELLNNSIEQIRRHNDTIEIVGYLINSYDGRNKADQRIKKFMEENYPHKLFQEMIPRTTKIRDARVSYQPIFELAPNHKISKAFKIFFKALNSRIEGDK